MPASLTEFVSIDVSTPEGLNHMQDLLNRFKAFDIALDDPLTLEHLNQRLTTKFGEHRPEPVELLKMLVDAGADINSVNQYGRTAAFNAKNPSLLQKMIDMGLDVNIRDKLGRTALFSVLFSTKNEEILEVLLKAGANLNEIDNDGHSAVTIAINHGSSRWLQTLIDHGADLDNPSAIFQLVRRQSLPNYYGFGGPDENKTTKLMLQMLVNAGVDLNVLDEEGWSPLALVCENNQSLLSPMIEHGANPNLHGPGKSPLIQLCTHNSGCGVRKLLLAGADVDVTDNEGRTPFYIVVFSTFTYYNVLAHLINAGADITSQCLSIRGDKTMTPREVAMCIRKEWIAQLIDQVQKQQHQTTGYAPGWKLTPEGIEEKEQKGYIFLMTEDGISYFKVCPGYSLSERYAYYERYQIVDPDGHNRASASHRKYFTEENGVLTFL